MQQDDGPMGHARRALFVARRRPFSAVAVVCAALLLVLLGQSLATGHFAPLRLGGVRNVAVNGQLGPSRSVAFPTTAPGELDLTHSQFTSIAATSPSDIWLGGSTTTGSQTQHVNTSAVILHFDGSQWSSAPNPSPDPITGIAMLAPGDGWAVAGSAILRYSNGLWSLYQTYPGGSATGAYLTSISMDTPYDGWIVGALPNNGNGASSILLHYAGGQWTPYTRPSLALNSTLESVSMHTPGDGWAVGNQYVNGSSSAVVAHYQNGAWTQVGTFPGANLLRVSAAGPEEAWAVGIGGPTSGLLVHCLDNACQQIPSPSPNILGVVTAHSSARAWVGGDGAVIYSWDGNMWTQRSPTYHQVSLFGLLVFSDSDGWAIGQSNGTSLPPGVVVFRCVNGVWQVYQLHVRWGS